jgi:hypothetical protein
MFGDFALADVPVGNARGSKHRPYIFEGVDTILREREPRGGTGLDQFFVFKEVRASI